ncbi:MAG TPA: diguanylate cyclase [Desulfuromonadales bacterium]|nr:diguanylate cyclase [Desulfuromonadales bacterium]
MQNSDDLLSKLTALSDSFPDPIFILAHDGTYLAVVGGSDPSLYTAARHLVGRRMQDVLPEGKSQFFLGVVRKAIASGMLQTCEYQLSPGEVAETEHEVSPVPLWFQGRVFPLSQSSEQPPAVLWQAINITEQKKREQQLQLLADIDDLTEVYNRRYFMTKLKNEFERSRIDSRNLSVISFDVDMFKGINDTHGHDSGDRALQLLTQVVEQHLRTNDIFARVGGEEFAVICPNTSQKGAAKLAERLREMVAFTEFAIPNATLRMTASFGVTALRAEDNSLHDLLFRADKALYDAKRKGRNMVCSLSVGSSPDQRHD